MSALHLTMGELAMLAEGRTVQAAHLVAQRAGVSEEVATKLALARRASMARQVGQFDAEEARQASELARIFGDARGAEQLRAMMDRFNSRIHRAALALVEQRLALREAAPAA